MEKNNRVAQAHLLYRCFELIYKNRVFPELKPQEWLKTLIYLHKNGWLFVAEEDGRIVLVACGYRVPELKDEIIKKYPEKEDGNIFYVPFLVSEAKDKLMPRRLLTNYLNNHPDIKTIAFHERGKELKTFNRTKQEVNNGQ